MTGELGNKIDSLWEIFWNGGITNPHDGRNDGSEADRFEKLNKTVTIPSLTKTDLLKIKINLPNLDEQQSIVELKLFVRKYMVVERHLNHTQNSMRMGIFRGYLQKT